MSASKALRARLVADATMTGLVGNRIYPGRAPQKPTMPYIVYHRISTVRSATLDSGNTKVPEVRMQCDVIATTQAEVETILNQMRLVMDNFRGTSAGVTVLGVSVSDEQDQPEYYEGSDTVFYHSSLDFSIIYRES
ncbi:MAG: DUF3168 domain-containing protein [Nitrosomonadaceae bacterium]|jgi:hypothetical protein|nr:DUF3168 domain-containing protein [Nitrosomonadaceae bacterium]